MFPAAMLHEAAQLLDAFRARGLRLVTAESCTGGLIAALLTEIPGSSDVLERGFVAYSNASKHECLGVSNTLIDEHGAVSAAVARAMAEGIHRRSRADVAISVYRHCRPRRRHRRQARRPRVSGCCPLRAPTSVRECRFGDIGRGQVRAKAVEAALSLLNHALTG